MKTAPSAPSIAADEVAQFSRLAECWWDPEGEMGILHRMNPARLGYIRDQISANMRKDAASSAPLQGINLLDIGCGGGLLTEPLCRMGATVTGLDASPEGIKAATAHAAQGGLTIEYKTSSAEEFCESGRTFDVITALEIVEHTANLPSLLAAASRLLKPKGLLFLSTVNRTPSSFLKAIVAAEYILGWVPKGTHHWRKFVRPSELADMLERHNINVMDISGVIYKPITRNFALAPTRVGNTYILTAQKQG